MRTLYLADTQRTDVLAADNVAASPLFNIWAFSDSVAFDSKRYEECVAETVKGLRKETMTETCLAKSFFEVKNLPTSHVSS